MVLIYYYYAGKFPSPCGVLGMKVIPSVEEGSDQEHAFPSPCGVLGMKVIL